MKIRNDSINSNVSFRVRGTLYEFSPGETITFPDKPKDFVDEILKLVDGMSDLNVISSDADNEIPLTEILPILHSALARLEECPKKEDLANLVVSMGVLDEKIKNCDLSDTVTAMSATIEGLSALIIALTDRVEALENA